MRLAEIQDGKPRYVDYVTDELGQVVYRREVGGVSGQTGNPYEVTYRFGGRQLGYTGNNGTSDLSVDASIADRQQVTPSNQGTFRNKQVTGTSYADFAQSYDPLNSFSQGSTAGGYTVQAGDTLQGIAYQLWGDAQLWYKLAEANGLSMASPLVEGMQLTLPAGVVRTSYNAATMRPYDPADAIGNLVPDTSPAPAPAARKKSNKCGVFGAILLAVVAVAVAAVVGPQAIAAAGSLGLGGTGAAIAGGALAAAAGSVASQAVGLATGIQDKFSFKGVALAALSGGVGGGVGSVIQGSGFLAGAARGIAGSAVTQGIAVATGLQDRFDWAGVAAAGIGGGVGAALGRNVAPLTGPGADLSLGNVLSNAGVSAASAIANAATRSAIEGSSFGDNILRAIPDVIGQTIGNLVAGKIQQSATNRADAKAFGEKVAELKGLSRGTAEFDSFLAANSDILKNLSREIGRVRQSGDGKQLVEVRDKYAKQLLSLDESTLDDAKIQLRPVGDVNVYATPLPPAIQSLIDPIAIEAGSLAIRVSTAANKAIDDLPGGRLAVGLLDLGLTIAGGPARAALGAAVGKVNDAAVNYLTDRFSDVGYANNDAVAGGVGAPFLLTLASSGAASALKLAGVIGGFRAAAAEAARKR